MSLDVPSAPSHPTPRPLSRSTHDPGRRTGRIALAVLALWALTAVALSLSGVMRGAPPQVIPATILGCFATFALFYLRVPSFRQWVLGLDLRPLILYHMIRIPFGVAFLIMHARDALPAAFAVPAGYGDIAAGAGAILAAFCVPAATRGRRRLVLLWNILALGDILMVFVLAQRVLIFGDFHTMSSMLEFPFSTIPLFVVPMILITHVAIFARLRQRDELSRHDQPPVPHHDLR